MKWHAGGQADDSNQPVSRTLQWICLCLWLVPMGSAVAGGSEDFSSYNHGLKVTGEVTPSGVTIVQAVGCQNEAQIFDTNVLTHSTSNIFDADSEDDDLMRMCQTGSGCKELGNDNGNQRTDWSGGNLVGQDLGNTVIIADDDSYFRDENGDPIDANGAKRVGDCVGDSVTFELPEKATGFGFWMADFEEGGEDIRFCDKNNSNCNNKCEDTGGGSCPVAVVPWDQFPNGDFDQDSSAHSAGTAQVGDQIQGITEFDRVVFDYKNASGAIAKIYWKTGDPADQCLKVRLQSTQGFWGTARIQATNNGADYTLSIDTTSEGGLFGQGLVINNGYFPDAIPCDNPNTNCFAGTGAGDTCNTVQVPNTGMDLSQCTDATIPWTLTSTSPIDGSTIQFNGSPGTAEPGYTFTAGGSGGIPTHSGSYQVYACLDFVPVSEPPTWSLLLIPAGGMAAVGIVRRRRKRRIH